MKKSAAALVVAVLMAAGLVATSGAPASAHCSPSQYAGCFKTLTKVTVTKKVPKRSRATICVSVTVPSGKATPRGRVVVSIQRARSSAVIRREVQYDGGKFCLVTRKLNKLGRYSVTAVYRSPSGSVFYDSSGKATFKVVRG
jgi:hypothetical protein